MISQAQLSLLNNFIETGDRNVRERQAIYVAVNELNQRAKRIVELETQLAASEQFVKGMIEASTHPVQPALQPEPQFVNVCIQRRGDRSPFIAKLRAITIDGEGIIVQVEFEGKTESWPATALLRFTTTGTWPNFEVRKFVPTGSNPAPAAPEAKRVPDDWMVHFDCGEGDNDTEIEFFDTLAEALVRVDHYLNGVKAGTVSLHENYEVPFKQSKVTKEVLQSVVDDKLKK